MKLLQTYADECSVEIKNQPSMLEQFFPIDVDKYITLQSRSGMPAKDYSYFQEVIKILLPVLEKENIKIVLLGDKDTPNLDGTINLVGKTSIHQSLYILNRALLHFGVDSWMCHACGIKDIPLVSLYGSTSVNNHSPYFYNKEKTVFLESHRNGNKCTFSREESPKTIDFIKIEDVVGAILKILGLPFDYPYKTLYLGPLFNQRILEVIPSDVINTQSLGVEGAVSRMDLLFNENNLFQQLQITKLSIITDKPITNLEVLKQLKPNIIEILYEIKPKNTESDEASGYDLNWVVKIQRLGIKITMFTYISDDDVLNNIKLESFEIGIIHRKRVPTPSEIKELEGKDLEKIYYKTNRFVVSGGKIFTSLAAMAANQPIEGFRDNIQPIINTPVFFKDLDFWYLLEKIK